MSCFTQSQNDARILFDLTAPWGINPDSGDRHGYGYYGEKDCDLIAIMGIAKLKLFKPDLLQGVHFFGRTPASPPLPSEETLSPPV